MSDYITEKMDVGTLFNHLHLTKPVIDLAVKYGSTEYKQGVAGDLTCDTMVIVRINNGGVFVAIHMIDDFFTVVQQKTILKKYVDTTYPSATMEFMYCQ